MLSLSLPPSLVVVVRMRRLMVMETIVLDVLCRALFMCSPMAHNLLLFASTLRLHTTVVRP